MDICGCSCLTWPITACRCAMEVAARLFLTQHSPPRAAHKNVLSRPLSLQALGSGLALWAQTPPPLVFHIPVASALPGWGPNCALDRLAPVASRHLPVGAQLSASILGYVLYLACCISLFSLCCSILHFSGDVDFDGGVVTWVQSNVLTPYFLLCSLP